MHARYETIDKRPALAFERRIAHPVQDVWAAITKPEELAQWFPCEVEVELRLGGKMRFVFAEMPLEGAPSTLLGEVTELDPPKEWRPIYEDYQRRGLPVGAPVPGEA